MVIIDKSGPVLGRDTCLATTYIMKKNQRQLGMWLCHGRVNILSGGHRELSPSCKMPEGPWLVPSQENGSLLFSLSFLLCLHFNFVLCCYHISTFFLFNFSGQFHMPLSYFMRNFFSEKLAYNHLPISMPPFWQCEMPTINSPSFISAVSPFALWQLIFFAISYSYIFMGSPGSFHKILPSFISVTSESPGFWQSYDCELFMSL